MDKALGIFLYLRNRLKEPSTYASLVALCAMFGQQLPDEAIQNVMNVASLAFGALGFLVAEAKPKTIV